MTYAEQLISQETAKMAILTPIILVVVIVIVWAIVHYTK